MHCNNIIGKVQEGHKVVPHPSGWRMTRRPAALPPGFSSYKINEGVDTITPPSLPLERGAGLSSQVYLFVQDKLIVTKP